MTLNDFSMARCYPVKRKIMVHPVQAYVAGKRLNTMLTACLSQDIRYFCLSPASETPLEVQSFGEESKFFSFLRVAVMKKGLPPQAGS